MERRRTAAVAVVVLAAVTGTGCSGLGAAAEEKPPEDPRADVVRVADVLTRVGSSRVRTAMEMVSGGTRLTIRGKGDFDFAKRSGWLKVTLPGGQQKPVTEVIVPGKLYMKNRGAGVPDDKWVRVDTAALSDGNLVTNGVTDPISAAELLRGAGKVTYAGKKEIDGEAVRHYRGIADIEAAARAAPEAASHSREQFEAAAKGFSRTAVPFDAYLDRQGRLREVRHEFVYRNREGEGVEVASTVVLYDFGAPVRIEMPKAADIYSGKIAAPDR